MSKPNIRKITVDPTKCNTDSRRPSVFERLGTKPAASTVGQITSDYCRNWALNGNCSYGKSCKYANTHTLISPSKRAKKDNPNVIGAGLQEDPFKRITSKIVKKSVTATAHSPDLNLEDWNQTDLEYEDEKVLERRRQLLQRELEIQMKKDKEVHGKDKTAKHKKKAMSSSSSSRSSTSSSSSSSSSSDDSSSSSSSGSDSRKKVKKIKSKRHHSAGSSDYDDDDNERKKKQLKLKRLAATKNDKATMKKKRKVDVVATKDTVAKIAKKSTNSGQSVTQVRKHSTIPISRTKSPLVTVSHGSTSKTLKDRHRSESPARPKPKETDKDRYHKKNRDPDDSTIKELMKNKSNIEKIKEIDKTIGSSSINANKNREIVDKIKLDDRSKPRPKDNKDRRSRTPPIDRSKHLPSKEIPSSKPTTRRSRTPEKSIRSKRDNTPSRHQDKIPSSASSRNREIDKKDRDPHKRDRSKERDERTTKNDLGRSRTTALQDDISHRNKNPNREPDEKLYNSDRGRRASKERRNEKDHVIRDDRSHSRMGRDQRDKDRDDMAERFRDRQRDREREKDAGPGKMREREIPSLMAVTASSSSTTTQLPINPRYPRDNNKERIKDPNPNILEKNNSRDRRNDRDRDGRPIDPKPMERDRGSLRNFDGRYDRSVDKEMVASGHKIMERERVDRFPRERSIERIVDKNPSGSVVNRDHMMERGESMYDRDRHRRFNPRFDRHPIEHERKETAHLPPPQKMERLNDRREPSPRRSIELDRNFDRGYGRLPHEHWDEPEEPQTHVDYRDHHPHDDDRRKPIERRQQFNNSPFGERRGRDERPVPGRYGQQSERPFDEQAHHHPMYPGEKLGRGPAMRDEANNENWDIHHDIDHVNRDRNYSNAEWEERDWRSRAIWDRESLPRSEAHEEEWPPPRYDSPMTDWKINDSRKWENPQVHHLRGQFRNDRIKELEMGEPPHSKRRPYNNPELRDDLTPHVPKQTIIHGNMKEEPINKKLMELAEGRPRRSREKSADSFPKKMHQQQQQPVSTPLLQQLQQQQQQQQIQPQTPVKKDKALLPTPGEPKEPPTPVETKRPCLDESLQTLHTESDLSDISDDPDDILDMEDEEIETSKQIPKKSTDVEKEQHGPPERTEPAQPSPPSETVEETVFTKDKEEHETNTEDDNLETMDFEEISDGELEEDIKTSGKGLGDALGVDWESLVKESQPRRIVAVGQDTAQRRWHCKAIFRRIGISAKYAGAELTARLTKKYACETDNSERMFLDEVAMLHTALVRRQFMRDSAHELLATDDSLYRMIDVEKFEDEDPEDLQPFTSLYEEAKTLLNISA